MSKYSFLKQRILLKKEHEEELDSWHTTWLFSCPENSFRFVLVVRNSEGKIVRRETFEDRDEAEQRQLQFIGCSSLLTFGREA